jgi:hypothetical protein
MKIYILYKILTKGTNVSRAPWVCVVVKVVVVVPDVAVLQILIRIHYRVSGKQ